MQRQNLLKFVKTRLRIRIDLWSLKICFLIAANGNNSKSESNIRQKFFKTLDANWYFMLKYLWPNQFTKLPLYLTLFRSETIMHGNWNPFRHFLPWNVQNVVSMQQENKYFQIIPHKITCAFRKMIHTEATHKKKPFKCEICDQTLILDLIIRSTSRIDKIHIEVLERPQHPLSQTFSIE